MATLDRGHDPQEPEVRIVDRPGYQLAHVREIRCPAHGDVTSEVVAEHCGHSWNGLVTVALMRSAPVHRPDCRERLLFSLFQTAQDVPSCRQLLEEHRSQGE